MLHPRLVPRLLLGLALLAPALVVNGCKDKRSELARIGAIAVAPTGGRGPAAAEIQTAVRAKAYLLADAIDRATAMLDGVAAGKFTSANATAFTGATLDAAALLDDLLPHGGEFELFWMNLGRLAFRSAEEAHAAGRVPEAMTLVFAGPQRWQNDAYWERFSDHDGLAAVLLAKSGQPQQAIERLQRRVELRGVALEVYNTLTGKK